MKFIDSDYKSAFHSKYTVNCYKPSGKVNFRLFPGDISRALYYFPATDQATLYNSFHSRELLLALFLRERNGIKEVTRSLKSKATGVLNTTVSPFTQWYSCNLRSRRTQMYIKSKMAPDFWGRFWLHSTYPSLKNLQLHRFMQVVLPYAFVWLRHWTSQLLFLQIFQHVRVRHITWVRTGKSS